MNAPTTPSPAATVLITTKNRKDELARAIESALAQTVPVEVYIIDDASTDGTSEMVRSRFPTVRLERAEESLGCVRQRSRGTKAASAPIVLSIDDDASLPSPRTVEQILRAFDHPRVGAASVPYIDMYTDQHKVIQALPGRDTIYVASQYRGTAHAVRRDVFIQLGGYLDILFFGHEESDYSVRMLNAGYCVRFGDADPIHHFESPRRDRTREMIFYSRNAIIRAWRNVPWPYMPFKIFTSSVGYILYGARRGYLKASCTGVWRGLTTVLGGKVKREPVSRRAYRTQKWLDASLAVPLAELEARMGWKPS